MFINRGQEPPPNSGPVKQEPDKPEDQLMAASTNAPPRQLVDRGATRFTGGTTVSTGPSKQKKEHGLKQQSIRSFNTSVNQTNKQPTNSNHSNVVSSHRSSNTCSATTDGSEYFELDDNDEDFDFVQLDELEQPGQQMAEQMDVCMDDYDPFPEDETFWESDVVQNDLNEILIEKPNNPLKMENPAQIGNGIATSGSTGSERLPASSPHNRGLNLSSSAVLNVKTECTRKMTGLKQERDISSSAERLGSGHSGFNSGTKIPCKQEPPGLCIKSNNYEYLMLGFFLSQIKPFTYKCINRLYSVFGRCGSEKGRCSPIHISITGCL